MKFGNIVQGENPTIFDKDRDTAKRAQLWDHSQLYFGSAESNLRIMFSRPQASHTSHVSETVSQ